jgi:hypothetical protein
MHEKSALFEVATVGLARRNVSVLSTTGATKEALVMSTSSNTAFSAALPMIADDN